MKFKHIDKNRKASTIKIIGKHIEHYRRMMIVVSSFMVAAALFFAIYWEFDEITSGVVDDYLYLGSHLLFLAVSILMIVMLVLNKYKKVSTKTLAIWIHVHAVLIVIWASLVCVLDLKIGLPPLIYFIACTAMAGLYVLEPIFFTTLIGLSLTSIIISQAVNNYSYFTGKFFIENIINTVIYIILIILIAFRHFRVTIREYEAKDKLEILTYNDELTGLLNERSYVIAVDKINEDIKNNKEEPFAVVLMDVNNLKATNDAHGHRYGCHLVVKCGHDLPTIFTSSKLFHIGGDEFVAIVYGEDLEKLGETIQKFDQNMVYSIITYEGVELIFSVARGYAIYQKGDKFQDVLQRADNEMYAHKKSIKEKYNFKGR